MTTIDDEINDFLDHHGVKGQRWGVRRATRKASKQELKSLKKTNEPGAKLAKKDPTFKREVKETKKGRGIDIVKETGVQKTAIGGLVTSRILGEFKNSKGEKVSEDFANAVLDKAVSDQKRKRLIAIGATFAASALIGTQLGKG